MCIYILHATFLFSYPGLLYFRRVPGFYLQGFVRWGTMRQARVVVWHLSRWEMELRMHTVAQAQRYKNASFS